MRKLLILFGFIIIQGFHSFGQNQKRQRDIQFYFNHLPDTCFQLCNLKELNVIQYHERVLDIRNGFIAFKQSGYEEEAPYSFQITLFKGKDDKDIIAVSARDCGDVFDCHDLTSFFYVYEDGNWAEADNILLPEIRAELFYSDSSNSDLLNKYGYFDFHYILPRHGTEIKIELSICDYLQFDHPEVTDHQYDKLIQEREVVHLRWEKSSNQFKIKN